jgi:hypothetical protein
MEIVTSGIVAAYGSFNTNQTKPNHAQLRVWRVDGKSLFLEQSQEWSIGDGVCAWNVGVADLDKNGKTEIVTVGWGTELEFVIMVIAVSCVKLLSAHNSTQHTSRKHKV